MGERVTIALMMALMTLVTSVLAGVSYASVAAVIRFVEREFDGRRH